MRAFGDGRSGPATIAAAVVVLALAGCSSDVEPVPAACTDGSDSIITALAHAPQDVALADGTRLSTCISRARTDGDLQSLGLVLVRAADMLRAQTATDPAAALKLGYLAGAVKAGAAKASGGLADQLARRVDQVATLDDRAAGSPAAAAALRRGRQAGERAG